MPGKDGLILTLGACFLGYAVAEAFRHMWRLRREERARRIIVQVSEEWRRYFEAQRLGDMPTIRDATDDDGGGEVTAHLARLGDIAMSTVKATMLEVSRSVRELAYGGGAGSRESAEPSKLVLLTGTEHTVARTETKSSEAKRSIDFELRYYLSETHASSDLDEGDPAEEAQLQSAASAWTLGVSRIEADVSPPDRRPSRRQSEIHPADYDDDVPMEAGGATQGQQF